MTSEERKAHERVLKQGWNKSAQESMRELCGDDPVVAQIVDATKDELFIYFSTSAPYASSSRRLTVTTDEYKKAVLARFPDTPDAPLQGKRKTNVRAHHLHSNLMSTMSHI